MAKMNIVPCLAWVKQGLSVKNPHKVRIDKDDLRRVIEETRQELDDEEENENQMEDAAAAAAANEKDADSTGDKQKRKLTDGDDYINAKYNLDDYDEEDEDDIDPAGSFASVAMFSTNDDDPYVTDKREDQSDDEDAEIQATDNLIVTGRAEEDSSQLEIMVYNEVEQYLYLHHDYLLPAFPLAIEIINADVGNIGGVGCYAAVGTMKPTIEIWDLNVMETLEPTFKLKGVSKKGKAKKKGTVGGHRDAVLDLSWNSVVGNVLASASADSTVALWDLSELKVVTSLLHHTDKVQCVKWHPMEAQSLLTGSFDKTVKAYDCRNPENTFRTWNLTGEVERILWDHFSPMHFFASTDQGHVSYFDVRKDDPVYTFNPHSKAVTGLSLSSQIQGLLVTTSDDKKMKVWDAINSTPELIIEKNLKMNELHCVGCCPEAPFVFAIGGDKEAKVWDIRESAKVRSHFLNRMPAKLKSECEGDEADISEDSDNEPVEAMDTLSLDNDEIEEPENSMTGFTFPTPSTVKEKRNKKKKKKKVPK